MTNTNPASEKQMTFLNTLIQERDIAPTMLDAINQSKSVGINVSDASDFINLLLTYNKKRLPVVDRNLEAARLRQSLSTVIRSRYAIPMSALTLSHTFPGDYLFLNVRAIATGPRKGQVYMNRLVGAPGDFTNYGLRTGDAQIIADYLLDGNMFDAAQKFGELYSCCGKCLAPLTDPESRRLKLGPVCRQSFGL